MTSSSRRAAGRLSSSPLRNAWVPASIQWSRFLECAGQDIISHGEPLYIEGPGVASISILVGLACGQGSGSGEGCMAASRPYSCATTRSIGLSRVT